MKKQIAIFGGSFNPPCKHHLEIIRNLKDQFERVIIFPCGIRQDKQSTQAISEMHRQHMLGIAISGMGGIIIDFHDLEKKSFTPTYRIQEKYEKIFPKDDIWHVVGGDIIQGGRQGRSEIHRLWDNGNVIWENLNFLVIERPGCLVENMDLPANSRLFQIKNLCGSGTMARRLIGQGLRADHLVSENVLNYIRGNDLYI